MADALLEEKIRNLATRIEELERLQKVAVGTYKRRTWAPAETYRYREVEIEEPLYVDFRTAITDLIKYAGLAYEFVPSRAEGVKLKEKIDG